MGEEGNEALNFVVEPPLISEEEIDDDHRCADQVVIDVLREQSKPAQHVDKTVHGFAPVLGDGRPRSGTGGMR